MLFRHLHRTVVPMSLPQVFGKMCPFLCGRHRPVSGGPERSPNCLHGRCREDLSTLATSRWNNLQARGTSRWCGLEAVGEQETPTRKVLRVFGVKAALVSSCLARDTWRTRPTARTLRSFLESIFGLFGLWALAFFSGQSRFNALNVACCKQKEPQRLPQPQPRKGKCP